jgi:hypothetical protein
VGELPISLEAAAEEQITSAVRDGGILFVGEIHGVLENPLVIYTLTRRFRLTSLALEWPTSIQPMVNRFLDSGDLSYSLIAHSADGRVTAGHFAVLRALSREGRLSRLVLFDLPPFTRLEWAGSRNGSPIAPTHRSWACRSNSRQSTHSAEAT